MVDQRYKVVTEGLAGLSVGLLDPAQNEAGLAWSNALNLMCRLGLALPAALASGRE